MSNRRDFIVKWIPFAGTAALLPGLSAAVDVPAITEGDPMAKAMGFVLDTKNANEAKYPKHTTEQFCGNCLHFATRNADSAKCDLFSKIVPKGGWCSGYSRRP